jgi:sirohydrochlorin ferrochelatase
MKVLMLIAHGSRHQAANDEVSRLAARIQDLVQDDIDVVVPAFLELAKPDINQGVDRCVALGASEIVVVPYFLAAGKHVASDIPSELECARRRHPKINIETAQYLGENEAMARLVIECSKNIVEPLDVVKQAG